MIILNSPQKTTKQLSTIPVSTIGINYLQRKLHYVHVFNKQIKINSSKILVIFHFQMKIVVVFQFCSYHLFFVT